MLNKLELSSGDEVTGPEITTVARPMGTLDQGLIPDRPVFGGLVGSVQAPPTELPCVVTPPKGPSGTPDVPLTKDNGLSFLEVAATCIQAEGVRTRLTYSTLFNTGGLASEAFCKHTHVFAINSGAHEEILCYDYH